MKYYGLLAIVLVICAAMSAQALEGRIIVVTAEEETAGFTPVLLPCDGAAPDGRLTALNQDTGEAAPVTLFGDHLGFVPPSLPAGQEQRFVLAAGDDDAAPRVRLEHNTEEGGVAVYIRGAHFTTYNYGDVSRIPCLWPVYSENGVTVTRNYPMAADAPMEGRKDHRHHVSIWTAFGDVNGADTWHRAPINTKSVETESGDAFGVIRAHNVWADNRDEPIVDEIREYRFYDAPAGIRLFDHTITFNAVYGDVVFGDDKEGIVAFRVRPELQGNEAGLLTNAAGDQGERNVYGTPMPWMDYSGHIDGAGNRGIALFSHPDNFREPCWHVRDYGLAAANPFALSDVCRMDEDGSYTLAEGESLTLAFRFYIHTGDVEEAEVAKHYTGYANAPKAAWAE